MAISRIPGPTGFYTFGDINDGTLPRSSAFAPGHMRGFVLRFLISRAFGIPMSLAPSGSLHFRAPEKYSGPVRRSHAKLIAKIVNFYPHAGVLYTELSAFEGHYSRNSKRYQVVAQKTSLPVELIAALHWREASGSFDRMMSNGAPLGKKSTIVPYDGPYDSWEDSAIPPLTQRAKLAATVELDKDPNDLVALASFAELWNGKGYFNRGVPSPYVYSGTDVYSAGKYVADGTYDAKAVDRQIGVVPMIVKLRGKPQAL